MIAKAIVMTTKFEAWQREAQDIGEARSEFREIVKEIRANRHIPKFISTGEPSRREQYKEKLKRTIAERDRRILLAKRTRSVNVV